MARAPTNKELANSIVLQFNPLQLAALLTRLLIRVLIPLARSAGKSDDNLVVLAFGIAAYGYRATLENKFSRSEFLRFRTLVQHSLKQTHSSQTSSRVAFALDYFIEAAQSGFMDQGASRRAFEALFDLDPRLRLSLRSDAEHWQSIAGWGAAAALTMPIETPGRPVTVQEVDEIVLARGADWSPWARWLRNRILGASTIPLQETLFAAIPAALWPDARKVNGWLANGLPPEDGATRREAPRPAAPEPSPDDVGAQETASINFSIAGSEQVHLDREVGQGSLLDDQLNNDLHHELIEKVSQLQGLCGSSNSLAELAVILAKFRESLGHSPLTLAPAPAVLRGNALRVELETDRARRLERDPDKPPLPEGIAGTLTDLVQAWNVYVGCDPYLDDIDRRRLGPDEGISVQFVPGEHSRVIDGAEREELATADAIAILRETEAVAQNARIAADRALAFQLRTMRNFARAAFRLALRHKGKIAAGLIAAVKFAHDHAPYLRKLLAGYPNLLAILDWIIDATRF